MGAAMKDSIEKNGGDPVQAVKQLLRTVVRMFYETEHIVPLLPFAEAIRAYVVQEPPDDLLKELGDGASERSPSRSSRSAHSSRVSSG